MRISDACCTDPNATMKSNWNFLKKVVYSFLLRIKIQNKNVYSKKEVFFNFEAVFWLSEHLWIGGEKSHPPKQRQECPAGILKLLCHMQLMTLCNMSEILDGDEPTFWRFGMAPRLATSCLLWWLFTLCCGFVVCANIRRTVKMGKRTTKIKITTEGLG